MNARKLIFSLVLCIAASGCDVCAGRADSSATSLQADTISSKYERNVHRYERFFQRLVPTHSELQYAGSIGFLSAGVGWSYYHSRWKSELLLGYVPKFHSDDEKYVLTFKQIYDPFRIRLGSEFIYHPLQTGVFLSYIFGGEFWDSEPKRYPKHYYGFSTGLRINALLGGQMTYVIPQKKRRMHRCVSVYYEFSTCDLYMASAFTNRNVRLKDILSLGLGMRMDIF